MPYPIFGKVKTITLYCPSDTSEMTLKQYREICGIDLFQYLKFDSDNGIVNINLNNTTLFVDWGLLDHLYSDGDSHLLVPVSAFIMLQDEENIAKTGLYFGLNYAVLIRYNSSNQFDEEHITIQFGEQ